MVRECSPSSQPRPSDAAWRQASRMVSGRPALKSRANAASCAHGQHGPGQAKGIGKRLGPLLGIFHHIDHKPQVDHVRGFQRLIRSKMRAHPAAGMPLPRNNSRSPPRPQP